MLKGIFNNKKQEREKELRRKNAKKIAIGTTIGAVTGAVAGILFAPKSGKETREDIKVKTLDTVENVKGSIEDIKTKKDQLKEKVVEQFKLKKCCDDDSQLEELENPEEDI